MLEGPGVRADLRRLVEDLSAAVGQPVEQANEPVLTVEEASRRYNVSTRTITRWRGQGLVARWFLIDGRPKVGFLESSLVRFVEAHRDQVDRGTKFQRLTDEEREEIIRRARRMAPIGQAGLIEIARRIAKKMERSTETVRMTLKTYDLEHPDRAIFPPTANPLDETTKAKIYRLYNHGRGVSAENLAVQFDRTRSSIYRILNEMRALRIKEVKLEFMPHPSFDDPSARDEILGPMPEPLDGKPPRRTKAPKGLAALPGQPLRGPAPLARAGEAPVPPDELPPIPRQQAPRLDRADQAPGPRTSTRSSGSRTRPSPSRTRSSAPTFAWSSRSPSGTSAPPTTSSTSSPTAT